MKSQLLQQISLLSVEEQIDLVEAIWDGVAIRGDMPAITEIQTTELERRLDDHLAHPDDFVSWDDVRAEARARLRR